MLARVGFGAGVDNQASRYPEFATNDAGESGGCEPALGHGSARRSGAER